MNVSVIPNLHAYYSTERLVGSNVLGSNASILFLVQRQHVLVTTTNGGSERILRQESHRFPEQVFNIELRYLLTPRVNKQYIHDMLTHMEIPPSNFERLKQEISIYAAEVAMFCKQRRSPFLEIIVELDVQFVEYYRELRSIEQDLFEAVQAMLTTDIIDGDGGFRLVPASRSSIDALEIKKFDDTEESSSSSSVETCMICMDEFEIGVDIARLPCSHSFHSECIVKWLENKNSCPLCRFEMPIEEE